MIGGTVREFSNPAEVVKKLGTVPNFNAWRATSIEWLGLDVNSRLPLASVAFKNE